MKKGYRDRLSRLFVLALAFCGLCGLSGRSSAQDGASDGRVSILRFIPRGEWDAIRACASHYDVTAAKDQADATVSVNTGFYSVGNGEVDWPAGCYWFSGALSQKHTVIEHGVSPGQAAGGATVWKFPANSAGVVIDRADTAMCRRALRTTSGQGTRIEDIMIEGGGGAPDATSHGVWMCVTAELINVNVRNFAGDGVHIDPNGVGNANTFRIYDGFISNVGRYGIYQHGADANAGLIVGTAISDVGGGCDLDLSFLGNTHVGELCQSAGRGLVHANYQGVSYQCLSVKCADVVPGSDQGVWYPVSPNPRYPPYVQGRAWLIGSDYVATDPNARALFLGAYAEEGDPLSDVRTPLMIQGGLQGSGVTAMTVDIASQNGLGGYVATMQGFGSAGRTPEGKLAVEAVIGGNSKNGDVVRSISNQVSRDSWRLRWRGPDLREDWNDLDGTDAIVRTGPKTAETFGRDAPQPAQVALPHGVFVGGSGGSRFVGEAPSVPAKGSYAPGDRVFNSAPRVLGSKGAQYTVTGWLRLTRGDKHVMGVDWVEMRAPTGS